MSQKTINIVPTLFILRVYDSNDRYLNIMFNKQLNTKYYNLTIEITNSNIILSK